MRYPISRSINPTQQKNGFSKLLAVLMKLFSLCMKHRQQQRRSGGVNINLGRGGGGGGGFANGFGNGLGNAFGNMLGGGNGGDDPLAMLGGGGGGGDPLAMFGGGGGGGGEDPLAMVGGGDFDFGGFDFMPNPAARNKIANYDNLGKY